MSSAKKNPLMEYQIPSKLLTRETSLSNPSFRVYYGKATGSVPFLWESQPGTPKHPTITTPCSNDKYAFPPLTPPPSYYSESIKKKTKSRNLLHIILPKLILRRSNLSYRSSSSSCSSSEPSSPVVGQEARQRHAPAGLSSPNTHFFSYKKGEEDEERSHTLMLCLGARW